MSKIRVNLNENSYYITIEKGLLSKIGDEVSQVFNGDKICVITDTNVNKYYGDKVVDNLINSGFTVDKIVLPPGEETKSFNILPEIYDRLLNFKLNRKDLIITLGGGVIGDLGGFAAATFLRGVSFIQVPTSLLAQVDSSVGGKVGVDLTKGKNLVGSFYQPKAVLIDPNVLDTLEERYFIDGMAEVIKYGCIRDKELFDKLLSYKTKEQLMNNIDNVIFNCCDIKRVVVENDEKDTGERMLLNYGHTLGHAIESYFNYKKYSHGEAVAIGMYQITLISEEKGLTDKGIAEKVRELVEQYGLPYEVDVENNSKIIEAIALDKKNLGDKLNVILIKNIGESYIYSTNKEFFIN